MASHSSDAQDTAAFFAARLNHVINNIPRAGTDKVGYTVTDVADAAGVSRQHLSTLASPSNAKLPQWKVVENLAGFFEISTSYFSVHSPVADHEQALQRELLAAEFGVSVEHLSPGASLDQLRTELQQYQQLQEQGLPRIAARAGEFSELSASSQKQVADLIGHLLATERQR